MQCTSLKLSKFHDSGLWLLQRKIQFRASVFQVFLPTQFHFCGRYNRKQFVSDFKVWVHRWAWMWCGSLSSDIKIFYEKFNWNHCYWLKCCCLNAKLFKTSLKVVAFLVIFSNAYVTLWSEAIPFVFKLYVFVVYYVKQVRLSVANKCFLLISTGFVYGMCAYVNLHLLYFHVLAHNSLALIFPTNKIQSLFQRMMITITYTALHDVNIDWHFVHHDNDGTKVIRLGHIKFINVSIAILKLHFGV